MKYKYAAYCSGNASRIIKYFEKYIFKNYHLQLVVYDGDSNDVKQLLRKLFNENVVFYCHDITLSKASVARNLNSTGCEFMIAF